MKRSLSILLLLIVFIFTTACNNQESIDNKSEQEETQSTPSEELKEDTVNISVEEELIANSKKIVSLLAQKDMKTIMEEYVDLDKGLLFSPFSYIEKDAIVFKHEKLEHFFHIEDEYIWGRKDGSGEPIQLTPSQYYNEYIYDADYQQAVDIFYDRKEPRGNTKSNISETFQDSHTVEYYIEGSEKNGNMDWKSLSLVFEKNSSGQWMLVAIVHDQWTI